MVLRIVAILSVVLEHLTVDEMTEIAIFVLEHLVH